MNKQIVIEQTPAIRAWLDSGNLPPSAQAQSAMLDGVRSAMLLYHSKVSELVRENNVYARMVGRNPTASAATRQPAAAPRPYIKPTAPAAVRQAPHTFIQPQAPPRPAPKAPEPEPVRTETPTLDKFNAMKGGMATLFFNKNAKQILAEQSVRTSEERAAARASK